MNDITRRYALSRGAAAVACAVAVPAMLAAPYVKAAEAYEARRRRPLVYLVTGIDLDGNERPIGRATKTRGGPDVHGQYDESYLRVTLTYVAARTYEAFGLALYDVWNDTGYLEHNGRIDWQRVHIDGSAQRWTWSPDPTAPTTRWREVVVSLADAINHDVTRVPYTRLGEVNLLRTKRIEGWPA